MLLHREGGRLVGKIADLGIARPIPFGVKLGTLIFFGERERVFVTYWTCVRTWAVVSLSLALRCL